MRTLILLAGLLAVGATSSCRRHVIVHEKKNGDVVIIERGHIHSGHCGHWFHRGQWHHGPGHVHAHNCGHVHRDGIWVIVD